MAEWQMPIFWRKGLKRGVVVIVFADPFSADDWARVMSEVLARPSATPPVRLLLDARYCVMPMQRVAPCMARWIELQGPQVDNWRVAMVFGRGHSPHKVGAPRPLVASAIPVEVFGDWAAAENWLQE
jgi:hypothetical protein